MLSKRAVVLAVCAGMASASIGYGFVMDGGIELHEAAFLTFLFLSSAVPMLMDPNAPLKIPTLKK
jgi:hypothetical protein